MVKARRSIRLLALGLLLAGCATEPQEGISVVLVSPDSLRADRLRPWNAQAAAPVPHLERLASQGTLYANAWAASPWTAPSMVSIMTGLYPTSHGVVYRDDTTPASLPTLPRLLQARDYEIGNFSFFSQISYFRNLGLGNAEPGLSHATVAESFGRWLGGLDEDQSFFAWVHLLETHLPYGATGYRAKAARVDGSSGLVETQVNAVVPIGSVEFEPGDRQRLIELYDLDVVEMDHAVGRVLDALEEHQRLDDTLIVFVGDHGEELLDHGWVGHASTAIHAKLEPEILWVPLILAGPGVTAGEIRSELVHHVDILPSIVRLLGLEAPSPMDGLPLPGIAGGWWGSRLWKGQRELAFFDTSPGGNLTPQEKRGERLQGLTDGRCLLAVRTVPGAPESARSSPLAGTGDCADTHVQRLREELEAWRQSQTEQRLAVLARHGGDAGPPSDEIDAYAEAIEVLSPTRGDRLQFDTTGGQVVFEWSAPGGPTYWLEYRLGKPPLEIQGSFQAMQSRIVFGPVPEGFWNDVATYSPSRIRIADAETRRRSPWIEFEVLPVE